MAKTRWKSTAFKYLLGLAVLSYVLYSNWHAKPGSDKGLRDALNGPVHLWPLLCAGLLTAAAVLLTFVRWWVLVRALALPLPIREAFRLGLIGYFFNTLLPGSIGGDVIKAAALVRSQERRTAAVASILIDRAVGLVGLILLVVLSAAICWLSGSQVLIDQPGLSRVVQLCVYLLTGVAAAWFVLGFLPQWRADRFGRRLSGIPKVGGALSEFWKAIWIYRQRPNAVLLALGLATCLHVLNVFAFHFAAHVFADNLGGVPSVSEHFLFVPVGMAVRALFPSPGGAGGAEFGFGKLYELAGRPPALGVLASLAILCLAWVLGALAYFVGAGMTPAKTSDSDAVANAPQTA